MPYTPHVWISRIGSALNRFLKQNETSTHVELVNDPTEVTQEGTNINVGWLNEMEEGIRTAHVTADQNVTDIETLENEQPFTIENASFPSANWVDNTATVGYWTFDYADARITESRQGFVSVGIADQANAASDGIQRGSDTSNGSIRIYATQQPTNDYNFDIYIGGA